MRENARMAERVGSPRFASTDDAFAIVGAIVELVSRQLRSGVPARRARPRAGDRRGSSSGCCAELSLGAIAR